MTTIQVQLPESLLLDSGQSKDDLQKRSQFLLALKYFELGQLSSGQAASTCGMSRAAFLMEASRLGVPVADLSPEEMKQEFGNG